MWKLCWWQLLLLMWVADRQVPRNAEECQNHHWCQNGHKLPCHTVAWQVGTVSVTGNTYTVPINQFDKKSPKFSKNGPKKTKFLTNCHQKFPNIVIWWNQPYREDLIAKIGIQNFHLSNIMNNANHIKSLVTFINRTRRFKKWHQPSACLSPPKPIWTPLKPHQQSH